MCEGVWTCSWKNKIKKGPTKKTDRQRTRGKQNFKEKNKKKKEEEETTQNKEKEDRKKKIKNEKEDEKRERERRKRNKKKRRKKRTNKNKKKDKKHEENWRRNYRQRRDKRRYKKEEVDEEGQAQCEGKRKKSKTAPQSGKVTAAEKKIVCWQWMTKSNQCNGGVCEHSRWSQNWLPCLARSHSLQGILKACWRARMILDLEQSPGLARHYIRLQCLSEVLPVSFLQSDSWRFFDQTRSVPEFGLWQSDLVCEEERIQCHCAIDIGPGLRRQQDGECLWKTERWGSEESQSIDSTLQQAWHLGISW